MAVRHVQAFAQKWNSLAFSIMRAKLEIMQTDKSQFDAVLSRMLQSPPKKTASIRAKKKAQAKPKPSAQK